MIRPKGFKCFIIKFITEKSSLYGENKTEYQDIKAIEIKTSIVFYAKNGKEIFLWIVVKSYEILKVK